MSDKNIIQSNASDDLLSLTSQLKDKDRLALIGIARLMVAIRNGSVDRPKLSMAYKNVDNILNAHPEWTFEEMGEHRPNKSWRIVDQVIGQFGTGFHELGLRLAILENIR